MILNTCEDVKIDASFLSNSVDQATAIASIAASLSKEEDRKVSRTRSTSGFGVAIAHDLAIYSIVLRTVSSTLIVVVVVDCPLTD
jgi:hypothetical protein